MNSNNDVLFKITNQFEIAIHKALDHFNFFTGVQNFDKFINDGDRGSDSYSDSYSGSYSDSDIYSYSYSYSDSDSDSDSGGDFAPFEEPHTTSMEQITEKHVKNIEKKIKTEDVNDIQALLNII